jgi:hypothetical protein
MLEENIQKVERGEDPMCTYRDPEQNQYLWMRTERHHGKGADYAGILTRQGAATKFSPILNARGVAKPLEGGPAPEQRGQIIYSSSKS